ncbi:MAG: N-acetyltransferase family protein [Bdellovibrionota bacterium]
MNRVRTATTHDAAAMLEIYSPYVLATPVSFETELPSLSEFQARIAAKLEKFTWLAYERDGQIIGYAYAGAFKSRLAYQWTAETSVYVRQGFHGKGIGKALYENLLPILQEQGLINVIGGMTMPNEGSRKLHEHFGFTQVAQFKDAGFKLGQWWDVGYWQLQFPKPEKPSPLLLPKKLDRQY